MNFIINKKILKNNNKVSNISNSWKYLKIIISLALIFTITYSTANIYINEINEDSSLLKIFEKNSKNIYTKSSMDISSNSILASSKQVNNTIINEANRFSKAKTNFNIITKEKDKIESGCSSIILHVNNSSSVYSYRRDSTYATDLYLKKTKISGKTALKEYKTTNTYFLHSLIIKDGWIVSIGGADNPSINKNLEKLGSKIAKSGKIAKKDLNKATNYIKRLGLGHFVIKSPKGKVGYTIYNRRSSKTNILKMKSGEYLCIPNSPSYYQKGKYPTNKKSSVNSAIYIASSDKFGVNRRNIMTYEIKNTANKTKIKVYVSNDNGKNVGRKTNKADNVIIKGKKSKKIKSKKIPKIPSKKHITTVTLK